MAEALTIDNILPNIKGKTLAIFGDLSKKRNMFIKQFIFDGFEKGETVCIVTLITSANDLVEELSGFFPEAGMIVNDAIFNEKLQIVDMYSFRGVKNEDPLPGAHILNSANDLTMLSIKLNEISKAFPESRFIIWPYSLLAIYTKPVDLINFTQTQSARFNKRDQVVLLVSDTGVIPKENRSVIESIVDSVLETKRIEDENVISESFRIKFYKGDDEYKFETWTRIEN